MKYFLLLLSIICSLQLATAQDIAYVDSEPLLDDTNNYTSKKTVFNSNILQSRLSELDTKTALDVKHNAQIENLVTSYLGNRKNDFANLMDKSNLYFPVFEKYLAEFNLPKEIKYLAVIESRLEANAKSHMGAKGLWQFMYKTGKAYGLKINSRIDDRLNTLKATKAACTYLTQLYSMFDDWNLALAAYNCGPGNVRKAIRRAGGVKNYWKIQKYLPKETRKYIPKFYATLYLFEYGFAHDIYPTYAEISHKEVKTIEIKNKLSFKQIQNRFNVGMPIIKKLNPQYRLGIISPTENEVSFLTLPKSSIESIAPAQSDIYVLAKSLMVKPNSYPVKEKNTYSEKFNGNKYKIYTVKEGDSLWKVSRNFANVTINNIRDWNNLWNVSYLKPGSKLKILTN